VGDRDERPAAGGEVAGPASRPPRRRGGWWARPAAAGRGRRRAGRQRHPPPLAAGQRAHERVEVEAGEQRVGQPAGPRVRPPGVLGPVADDGVRTVTVGSRSSLWLRKPTAARRCGSPGRRPGCAAGRGPRAASSSRRRCGPRRRAAARPRCRARRRRAGCGCRTRGGPSSRLTRLGPVDGPLPGCGSGSQRLGQRRSGCSSTRAPPRVPRPVDGDGRPRPRTARRRGRARAPRPGRGTRQVGPDPETIAASAPYSSPTSRVKRSAGRSDTRRALRGRCAGPAEPGRSPVRSAAIRSSDTRGSGRMESALRAGRTRRTPPRSTGRRRRAPAPSGRCPRASAGVSEVPVPTPTAVPPTRANGTSAPRPAASSCSSVPVQPQAPQRVAGDQGGGRVGTAPGHARRPPGSDLRRCRWTSGRHAGGSREGEHGPDGEVPPSRGTSRAPSPSTVTVTTPEPAAADPARSR
jgi:hypothetical protein